METSSEFLARLGTDGEKWAKEFLLALPALTKEELDFPHLVGWFANAIEAGRSAGESRYKEEWQGRIEKQIEKMNCREEYANDGGWAIEDVQAVFDVSDVEARRFLAEHERSIRDAVRGAGWTAIEYLGEQKGWKRADDYE